MAYYRPLQKENKRWYYTCTNGAGTMDEPCCSQYELCSDCGEKYLYEENLDCRTCNNKRLVKKENPCPGHDTPEGAIEHNRQYQISKAEEGLDDECQYKCKICGIWTQKYMYVPGDMWMQEYLCDEHCNKEGLDLATKPKPKEEIKKAKLKKPEGFIPKDFDEAVDYLVAQKVAVNDPSFHFSGGMAMRNEWGLWHNYTPIAKWFTDRGLYHGDDRSGILAEAVDAKLRAYSFDVDARIKYYQDWWFNQYGEECSLENMRINFLKSALTEDDYEEND